MLILCIRTDKLQAELILFEESALFTELKWEAHRQLADTIHIKIEELLKSQQKTWVDIQGLVVYKGPGSFTGLRIGISVANSLAYGLNVPIVGEGSDTWQAKGTSRLLNGENEKISLPEYGGEANITLPKK